MLSQVMKNTAEIAAALQPPQRVRLLALLKSKRELPWEEGDDELKGLRLIHIRRLERGKETTELNNDGWAIAMQISGAAA
jgi:hypothetical protein